MSDAIKRVILQKFHQFFALRFYNALRMFCDIKLWAFDTTAFIAIGYCIRERIVTNIYVEESIQYRAVIWHDLIAQRHGLADAYWWMHCRCSVPMLFPDECAPSRRGTRASDASACSESGCIPEDKLSSRSSDFASRYIRERVSARCQSQCNACRSCHMLGNADSESAPIIP